MKTGIKRLQALMVAVLASLVCAPALAADWQISDLMQQLARIQNGRATFVEKKYIGIVDKPVESTGELVFRAPDKLEKRTLKPVKESLLFDGKHLILDRPGKTQVDLAGYPEALAIVESIRGTLAGDRSALEKVYRLTLSGSADKWQLILLPRYTQVSGVITRVVIRGSGADVSRVDIDLADGDRTEMTITKVAMQ